MLMVFSKYENEIGIQIKIFKNCSMQTSRILPILFLINFHVIAQVKINSVKILSDSTVTSIYNLKQDQIIELAYNQNVIQVQFEANKTTSIPNYAYILQNVDVANGSKNWINCGNQNSINLSYLEGGNYRFSVKNLKENKLPTSIFLNVELPFWRKWWFVPSIFIYIMSMVGVVMYLFTLYRFRQQTKLQRVRNDIASDLHDDVGATLSSISFFGEMMRSKVLKNAPPEEVLPLLEKLISTSKETIETMRGVVWTINPNNDTATDFFQKLNSFGKEMLAAKNIEFNFEAIGFENVKLPLDIQRNLFLFYKETINNIAKHSKATSVEVNIAPLSFGEGLGRSDASVRFDSTDNGIGFNPTELHEGHGLKSLRKRADELQGNLEIISAQGQGTKIILTFPLN